MVKFLISGGDADTVKAFFSANVKDVKFLSTTETPNDVLPHINGFQPDGFIYCAKSPSETQLENLKDSYALLQGAQRHFYVVGNDADLDVVFSKLGSKIKETLSIELGHKTIIQRIKEIAEKIGQSKPETNDNSSIIIESKSKFAKFMDNNDLDPSMLEKLGTAAAHAIHAGDISKDTEKKRIMIIDDDPNVLRTIRNYLQDQYVISVASSGRVALKFLEDKTVDLILLDYMMPEMDGPLVLNCIRQSPTTRDIPVVFLTGVSEKSKIKEILDMNIQGYLLKPVDAQKLIECVHNALQEN